MNTWRIGVNGNKHYIHVYKQFEQFEMLTVIRQSQKALNIEDHTLWEGGNVITSTTTPPLPPPPPPPLHSSLKNRFVELFLAILGWIRDYSLTKKCVYNKSLILQEAGVWRINLDTIQDPHTPLSRDLGNKGSFPNTPPTDVQIVRCHS